MNKEEILGLRISKEDKEAWFSFALLNGYESISEFVRDSINTIIKGKKSSKIIIIENKEIKKEGNHIGPLE